MMPAKRSKSATGLRSALAEQSRDFLRIAEQHEQLGAVGAVARRERELAEIEAGEPVVVPAWRLADALANAGAPLSVAKAVLAATGPFVVDAAGDWLPARHPEVGVR